MSLRKLTLGLTILMTVGLAGIILVSMTSILNRHFAAQEKKDMYRAIQQVQNDLETRAETMAQTGSRLANADAAYALAGGETTELESWLPDMTDFKSLGVDLIILTSPAGQGIFMGSLTASGVVETAVPEELSVHFAPGEPLLSPGTRGLVIANGRPMLIAVQPVLRADGSGPARGALILGRYLDQGMENDISELLLVSVEAFPLSEARTDPAFSLPLAYTPSSSNPYFVELSAREAIGYLIHPDIFSEPAVLLRVSHFPSIYTNGLLVNGYLMTSVALITIMFSATLFFMIEFYVLRPVWRLSRDVQSIGTSRSLSERLAVKGRDELSMLGGKINAMLDLLEEAQTGRQETEQRFRTLVESMEDMVFSVEAADPRVHLFGKKVLPAVVRGTGPLALPLDMDAVRGQLERELAARPETLGLAFEGQSSQFEWTMDTPAGARFFLATLSPIYAAQPPRQEIAGVVGVSKDMTAQKKLEKALRSRIAELDSLFSISRQFLDDIEHGEIYPLITRLAVEELGMRAAWVLLPAADGLSLFATARSGALAAGAGDVPLSLPGSEAPPASPAAAPHPAAAAFKDQRIHFADGPDEEHSLVYVPLVLFNETAAILACARAAAPGEESLPLLSAFSNLARAAMQNRLLFVQVVNGRERLQSASMRLVEIQEEERRQIALELHDEIGQVLTGLRLSLDMVRSLPPGQVQAQVDRAIEGINEMISRVRQMSLDLRPSILDDLGVTPTLLWYFDRYTSQTGIQVNFQHSGLLGQRFSPAVEITAYRVVQEALTNVARHAKVDTVDVILWRNQDALGIQVEDQGVGFSQEDVANVYNSKGLMGMRERVGFLRGQFNIITQPGEGTCITVEIPLAGFAERRRHER